MGGSQSTSKVDSILKIITDVTNVNMQSCSTDVKQSINKNLVIRGSNANVSDINMNNYATLNLKCLQKADVANKISKTIKNQITQLMKANSVGLLGAASRANTNSQMKVINDIKNKLTTKNIQKCAQSLSQSQSGDIIIAKSAKNVTLHKLTFDNVAKTFTNCIHTNVISNDLKTLAKLEAKQTGNAKDDTSLWATIFGSGTSFYDVIIILAIVSAVGGVLYALIKYFSDKNSDTSASSMDSMDY